MSTFKVKVLTVPVKAAETNGMIICGCGMSRKANKPCLFCERGTRIARPYVSKKYPLVEAHEMTPMPKGDHYMER